MLDGISYIYLIQLAQNLNSFTYLIVEVFVLVHITTFKF
jgi:hypothetical protein